MNQDKMYLINKLFNDKKLEQYGIKMKKNIT